MFDPRVLTLVAITDGLGGGSEGVVARAAAAARGGATMIQLRLKDAGARTLVEVARALVSAVSIPVIVNDRADVALVAGAAGVHVGSDDLPAAAVRRIAPPGFIVGVSVGSDAEVAGAVGADYVGIGPVYDTASKHDAGAALGVAGFSRLARSCGVPAVAIGGIDAENAPAVMAAGASGVAMIRGVFAAPDPALAARLVRSAIGR